MTGWCGGGGAGEARRCRVLWMKVLWFFLSRKNVFAATWLRFLSVWASEKRGSFAPLKMMGGAGWRGGGCHWGGREMPFKAWCTASGLPAIALR